MDNRFTASSFLVDAEGIMVADSTVKGGSRPLNGLQSFIVPVALDHNSGLSIVKENATVNYYVLFVLLIVLTSSCICCML